MKDVTMWHFAGAPNRTPEKGRCAHTHNSVTHSVDPDLLVYQADGSQEGQIPSPSSLSQIACRTTLRICCRDGSSAPWRRNERLRHKAHEWSSPTCSCIPGLDRAEHMEQDGGAGGDSSLMWKPHSVSDAGYRQVVVSAVLAWMTASPK